MPDDGQVTTTGPQPQASLPSPKFFDTQSTLALLVVVSFVCVIVLLVFHPVSSDTAYGAVLFPLLGGLGAMSAAVVSYYFGSSQGSTQKDSSQAATVKTLVAKVANGEQRRDNN